jgi:hypothetical protein
MDNTIKPVTTTSKTEYIAFDAMSLRQLIIDRLNEQQTFTDQNYVGSNLASIIDIISYAYHTLIFYLNRTSSESMFTESQLYENMNRVVKLIDYSPIGFQTSTLTFNCSSSELTQGVYTIPRYTAVIVNSIPYSFNEDITFIKYGNDVESLTEISDQKLLYQGVFQEYPQYIATGDNNEVLILNTQNELVDHFNIYVYVKPKQTQKWEEFTKTTNFYLESSNAKKFEIRLNENKRYEIKFGNDINGYKLKSEDVVAVYYLNSLGEQGVIGANAMSLDQPPAVQRLNTLQYNELVEDILTQQYRVLDQTELETFLFTNTIPSTPIREMESVDEIRQTAPAIYRSQYRLVTNTDYEVYIKTNFSNLITDIKVLNNWEYTTNYLKYFYNIGIQDPLKTERALLNHVQFADSCNFNNIYCFVVPRSSVQGIDYLLPGQKQFITSSIQNIKMTTTETIFVDPVYKAVGFGIRDTLSTEFDPVTEEPLCYLEIIKTSSSRKDNQTIINSVVNVINNYFSRNNLKLGHTLDIRQLTQQILAIDGIETFFTTREDDPSIRLEGLSFFIWNPVYPQNDKKTTANNVVSEVFEYFYFNNIDTVASRIRIVPSKQILLESDR